MTAPRRPPGLDGDLEVLRRWGAERQPHSMQSLLDHLLGTHDVLARWGCRRPLCRAGLFHSIYGTESFWGALKSLDERGEVRCACGDDCEEIVYLFSVTTRQSFDDSLEEGARRRLRHRESGEWIELAHGRHRDLCHLSAANWIEQVPRLTEPYVELGRQRSRLLLGHLAPAARDELAALYGDD